MGDPVADLLIKFATLTAATWAGTAFLPKAIPWLKNRMPKPTLALILGPLLSLGGVGTGIIEVPVTGWKKWAAAAFVGILATIISGAAQDKVIKAAKKRG